MIDLLAVTPPSTSILTPDEFRNFFTVVGSVIAFGVFFLTFLSVSNRRKISKTADDAAVVRYQVENSHTINMRDDADGKHEASTTMQDRILDGIKELRTSMDGQFVAVRKDIQRLNEHDDRDDQRLRDLEKTQPAKTIRKPRSPK